ncbi:MAG: VTT domain-containing protein [Verrucomicrobia subdivision 3 bacterium]|nr:VTT domain-containing protein [Verrucomicrobiales bacterium]MCI0743979.1 VTT domain-containing protein [Limisphaerales bacterium]
MSETLDFLTRYGPLVLFLAVFIEQMGIPLPAAPWLLAAGVLAGAGKMSVMSALAAATVGALLADLIWFYLGQRYGRRVLKLICRISLEQDSCVRRTEDVFERYGMSGVIAAKFIPGLSTITAPLAGRTGVSLVRFFFFDGLGSLLYASCFVLGGVLFSDQLEQILSTLDDLGHGALALVIALVALYIGYKYYQRRRLLIELRMERITVDELYRKLEAGEKLFILDLRHRAELEQEPLLIRGALHITADELKFRHEEIPRDCDVILYCSCPNEESSARATLLLRRSGIVRVHPLLGGFDAWRERNYPTESRVAQASIVSIASTLAP